MFDNKHFQKHKKKTPVNISHPLNAKLMFDNCVNINPISQTLNALILENKTRKP